MALQDLTPQLRTRLSRMERAVGWFVFLATALLLFGFGYYIYQRAESKGWFKIKAQFQTYVRDSTGLKVGDAVVMMGFPIGQITLIHAMPPGDKNNVRVELEVRDNYFRYIWAGGSFVKVNSADFLGKRQLEITRGTNGPAICVTQPGFMKTIPELQQLVAATPEHWQLYQDVIDESSNVVFGAYTMLTQSNLELIARLKPESNSVYAYDNTIERSRITDVWRRRAHRYEPYDPNSKDAYLPTIESPALTERLDAMIAQVQNALPGILSLTNKISAVLDNTANATSNLNITVSAAQPMLTNFAIISGQLREPGGVLTWALGTNGDGQFQSALTNVNALLVSANTNLNDLADSIGLTLENLSDITSNLNVQVQNNPNLMFGIVKTIGDADDLMQGLKRHWLLRSAFKTKTTDATATKTPAKNSGGK